MFIVLNQHKLYCRPEEYKKKVSDFVKRYATEEALRDPAEVTI